jgi:hypothetical protein
MLDIKPRSKKRIDRLEWQSIATLSALYRLNGS